ncbi:hypothetical protein ADUPG1_002813, partial [Aduncisulcus paluster]
MNGEMKVRSQIGEGSEFKFSIPLAVGDEIVSEEVEYESIADKKVLIVDDHIKNRMVARGYLEKYISDITECEGGDQAITLLLKAAQDNAPFDLIISDFQMPRMSGIELAQVVRAIPAMKDTAFIVMSSTNDKSEIEAIGKGVINSVVVKPFRRRHFLNQIHELLTDRKIPINSGKEDEDKAPD